MSEQDEKKEMVMDIISVRSDFINNGTIKNFGDYDFYAKLAVSQVIEKKFIKKRNIGGTIIPYLPHTTAEKILNFLFNFRVSNEVLEVHSITKMSKTSYKDKEGEWKQKDTESYDAWALVKFTFVYPDGTTVIRTVIGTHKGYLNPATSEHEAKKSAISKAWVVVARTFGIGTELAEKEDEGANRAYKKQTQSTPNRSYNVPY